MKKLLAILVAALPAMAQLPEYYKTVDRVIWVVGDAGRVTEAWDKTGLLKVVKRTDVNAKMEFRGRPTAAKARMVSGWLGDLRVDWIQPDGTQGAFAEFLKKRGDGAFAILHRTPGMEAFNQEIERLRGLGVALLQRGNNAGAEYAYFDTAPEGRFVLGLICGGEDSGAAPQEHKINQIAFAAHDFEPISAYWQKLGFPRMAITHAGLHDVKYRGQPVDIQQDMGWYRFGKVPYEWILPVKGPNIFDDHMRTRGEGLQHLGHPVPDMDRAIAEWGQAGYSVTQSGAWGEAGKKGSGRFAYIDTEKIGGMALELLWNFRE